MDLVAVLVRPVVRLHDIGEDLEVARDRVGLASCDVDLLLTQPLDTVGGFDLDGAALAFEATGDLGGRRRHGGEQAEHRRRKPDHRPAVRTIKPICRHEPPR